MDLKSDPSSFRVFWIGSWFLFGSIGLVRGFYLDQFGFEHRYFPHSKTKKSCRAERTNLMLP